MAGNMYSKPTVRPARRTDWYKKYIYTSWWSHIPILGYCLKTRKPQLGAWSTHNYAAIYARSKHHPMVVIESPTIMLRLI